MTVNKSSFEIVDDEINEGKTVNRLTDMDTKEVSIVDRPAIRRKFLVIKRDETPKAASGAGDGAQPSVDQETTSSVDKQEEAMADENSTKTNESLLSRKIDSILGRVTALKGVIAGAETTEKTASHEVDEAVASEVRSIQFALKGMAGVSKGLVLFAPGPEDLDSIGQIGSKVKQAASKVLPEVEKRLTAVVADLGDSEILDSEQVKKVNGAADLVAKVARSSMPEGTLVILKSSLSEDQREIVMDSIMKTMNGLGDLYVGLQTEATIKVAKVAGQTDVSETLHGFAADFERAVAEILTGIEKREDFAEAIETVRSVETVMDAAPEAKSVVKGVLARIQKAASMFRSKTNWDLPDGDPKKYVVIQEFAPDPPKQVGFFATRMEADNEALKQNVMAVTKVAKAIPSVAEAQGGDETTKGAPPEKKEHLKRLKEAVASFQSGLVDAQSGSLSAEKFKKAATTLQALDLELSTIKRAIEDQGLPDATDTGDPNMGSGDQPDSSAIGTADDIVGPGTPAEVTELIKSIRDEQAETKKQLESLKVERATLSAQVATLKKRRVAPSAPPPDAGSNRKEEVASSVAPNFWPQDLNDL